MRSGAVLVSAATAARAAPYVAALVAGGIPVGAVRIITPPRTAARAAANEPAEGESTAADTGASGSPTASVPGVISKEELEELAADAAGLVLCGGDDVDPRRYGEEPLAGAGVEVAPRRDELELALLDAARARRLPVWGICRGFQVINVFFGGSLWQDLPLQRPGAPAVEHDLGSPPDRLAHTVRVLAPDAPLGERLAAAGPAPRVNSRHHQGVRRLGAGLLAVAAAADGLIEAAVWTDGAGGGGGAGGWWVRGVEWHPENLLALPEQLALWRDFAAAVASSAGRDRLP